MYVLHTIITMYGFCSELKHLETVVGEWDESIIKCVGLTSHILYIPLASASSVQTRPQGHQGQLPGHICDITGNSFNSVPRYLYNFVWFLIILWDFLNLLSVCLSICCLLYVWCVLNNKYSEILAQTWHILCWLVLIPSMKISLYALNIHK